MTETQLAEEVTDNQSLPEPSQSAEEKFLGVKSTVGTKRDSENIEVEIVDDRPEEDRKPPRNVSADDNKEEVSDLSENANKRIKKLKYDYHEERREKEAALRLRDEAVDHAKRAVSENQRLSRLVGTGQQELVKQATEKAEYAKKAATKAYKEAYESGDAEAIAQAQSNLTDATFAHSQAINLPQQVANQVLASEEQERAKQPRQQQPQQQSVQTPPEPDKKAREWASDNEWFGKDEEMTSLALGLHEKLVRSGVNPSTDEYYRRIDETMQKRFPENFGDNSLEPAEKPAQRKPSNVVAPATRSTAPKKVRLSKTQVAFAKKLKLTPEQYAREMIKLENANG